jgi:hypothetical protein
VCTDNRAVLILDGKGTVPGAKVLVDLVDAMHDELGHGIVITALVDMRFLHGAPMRAQAIILRRLMAGKHQIAKASIVSANAFEMGVARTILGMTGMGARTYLTRHLPEAVRFLDWPAARYAG